MFYKSFSYWISIFQYSHEKFFSQNIRKFANTGGRGIILLFDARAGKQQFFTNFHAAASQEVFQERPGLLFLKTSPEKPSFIILQTWILPDYTTQYTNTALKTSRKLCLLVVERAPTTFAQGDTAAQDSSISNFFGFDICHCKNRLIWSKQFAKNLCEELSNIAQWGCLYYAYLCGVL